MIHKHTTLITLGALLLVGAIGIRVHQANQRAQEERVQQVSAPMSGVMQKQDPPRPIALEPFLDPKTYTHDQQRAPALEAAWPPVDCPSLVGGVVNHHALAGDLISAFFVRVFRCHPHIRTLIILSPDHYRVGTTPVTLGSIGYTLGTQSIRIDTGMLARATSTLTGVTVDQGTLFRHEHGVGALLVYAAPQAPDVRVLPVAVDASIQERDATALRAWLERESARDDVFIIVSSDMSHYLRKEVALTNDITTQQMFARGIDAWFWKATDAYTDNGRAIATVIRALAPAHWRLWKEGISTDYKGDGGFTTSYLIGGWLR